MAFQIVDREKQFLGADFHIHTPASNCYKGDKTDEEYMNILRRYHENEINIIAITDHNTIKGYKKIEEIKNDKKNNYAFLTSYVKNYPDLLGEYEKVKKDIELFDQMLILPGVEFEANPGIHILLIFDPEGNIAEIEKFLIDYGYDEETQGCEEIAEIPNIDVINLLEQANKLGAITIAAHADSKKGIYNDLSGSYRAQVFKSAYLNAISYNSTLTSEKIKGLFKQREYKRTEEIAYIQSSDYHGEETVGKLITYLRLEEHNFHGIKQAFSNPVECVSPTANPEVINVLKKIIEDPKTVCVQKVDWGEENVKEIKEKICAILNQGYGTIIFGAYKKPTSTVIGIKEDVKTISEKLINILHDFKQSFSSSINVYEYGNNTNIPILKINSVGRHIYYIDNKVYVLKKEKVEVAVPKEIEKMVEENLLKRMQKHQSSIVPQFEKSINKLNLYKDVTTQFIIINKIEKYNININTLFELQAVGFYEEYNVKLNNYNGGAEGNVYLVNSVASRLEDAYLRCSCPKTDEYDINLLNKSKKFKGEAIVIVSGGGTYYISEDDEWVLIQQDRKMPAIVLQLREEYRNKFSMVAIALWFKSSLLLWYSGATLDSTNIHDPKLFKQLVLPGINIFKKGSNIEQLGNKILEHEIDFLSTDTSEMEIESIKYLIDEHNKKIDLLAKEVDKKIFEVFNLGESEQQLISEYLNVNQIYNVLERKNEN